VTDRTAPVSLASTPEAGTLSVVLSGDEYESSVATGAVGNPTVMLTVLDDVWLAASVIV
jgi:hypothetical protein